MPGGKRQLVSFFFASKIYRWLIYDQHTAAESSKPCLENEKCWLTFYRSFCGGLLLLVFVVFIFSRHRCLVQTQILFDFQSSSFTTELADTSVWSLTELRSDALLFVFVLFFSFFFIFFFFIQTQEASKGDPVLEIWQASFMATVMLTITFKTEILKFKQSIKLKNNNKNEN